MKLRTDFVSNSSSCSFIIETEANLTNTIKTLKETFTEDDSVPYEMDIEVRAYAKNKNLAALEKYLTGHSSYCNTYVDWKTHDVVEKDPEEIEIYGIPLSLEEFLKISLRDDIYEHIDKIEYIHFQCEDCEYEKCNVLSLLYSFFAKHGCNPDDSDTEHDFSAIKNSSFLEKLTK